MKNDLLLAIVFLALALIGVVLKKTYFSVPEHELKRRARTGDPDATSLYKAVSYGLQLKCFLWLYIALTASASLVLLSRTWPVWLSIIVIAVLLYLVFSLLPSRRVSKFGLRLTKLLTPLVAKILSYLRPLFRQAATRFGKYYSHPAKHTGLFEPADVLDLLKLQHKQADNRLSKEQLEVLKRALTFSDKKVSDVLIPKQKVKALLASDTIGPILINELHESGEQNVLVKESAKGRVVGTLAFKDLGLQSEGRVKDLMSEELEYLNEDDPLSEAVQAFYTTNHTLYVVVNSSEEFVGIVTIELVLRELLGSLKVDEFDSYSDLGAVASRYNKPLDQTEPGQQIDDTPVKTEE